MSNEVASQFTTAYRKPNYSRLAVNLRIALQSLRGRFE